MTNKPQSLRLSSGEMELMSLLWAEGPATITEAHLAFEKYGDPVSYPTMQTRLNRLVDKGLVEKSQERPSRYSPLIRPEQVVAGHLNQLLDTIAGGSVAPLVSHLISERPLTPQEIRELKKLLGQAERAAKQSPPPGG